VAALSIRTDLATMAKSVTRGEAGQLAGSTKDTLKSAAVKEGAKHGISPRTVERALAKARPTPATRARGGAVRPRSPRPGGRRKPDAAPPRLNSLAWSLAPKNERLNFLNAVGAADVVAALGFERWWKSAPPEWRTRARNTPPANAEMQAPESAPIEPPAPANLDAAKDDLATPKALKRTPLTDRLGRPRPEPGSRLKPDKKRGRR
jgi:hypothetical protein